MLSLATLSKNIVWRHFYFYNNKMSFHLNGLLFVFFTHPFCHCPRMFLPSSTPLQFLFFYHLQTTYLLGIFSAPLDSGCTWVNSRVVTLVYRSALIKHLYQYSVHAINSQPCTSLSVCLQCCLDRQFYLPWGLDFCTL